MAMTPQQQAELRAGTTLMEVAATLAAACAAHRKSPAEMVALYRETLRALQEKPKPGSHGHAPSST